MKPINRVAAVLILAVICVAIGYHLSYPLKLNIVTLPKHIQDFYNRGRIANQAPTIVLYDGVGIGNKEYYLVEIGEDLGSVTLEKGLFGRCRIHHLSYGSGNFLDGIIKSGEKKYLLFGGRDYTSQISRITVSIDGLVYDLYVPKAKDHFLLYTEIDNRAEDNHVNRGTVVFYNEKGDNITGLYDLSGGGIQ